jgi:glycosyltransferase involved in cell wall biosynthesis
MRSIVLYSKILEKTSGLHTFERAFLQHVKDALDVGVMVTFVYDAGNQDIADEFSKYCPVVKNTGQVIRCDVCVYSSIFHGQHNIQAQKYVQMYHAHLSTLSVKSVPDKIDAHVAVSQSVADDLIAHFHIQPIVIENMLAHENESRALRMVTASRLAPGKGIERIADIARQFQQEDIPYIWSVFGEGSNMFKSRIQQLFKDVPRVAFCGPVCNAQPYMRSADYVVQLSDHEGYCYSIREALQVNTPVIVTRWDGVESVVTDTVNGYILDMDLSNLNVRTLYDRVPVCDTLRTKNQTPKWLALFNLLLSKDAS